MLTRKPSHRSWLLLERAVVLVHQIALDGDRALEGRLAVGHDGVAGRPRRDGEAVVPDLAVAGVGILDHVEGRGVGRARGRESGGGNDGGSGNGADVMHGYLPLSVGLVIRWTC